MSSLTSGRSILDVGCGSGLFMDFSKRKGWTPVGIEPSRLVAKQAKKR